MERRQDDVTIGELVRVVARMEDSIAALSGKVDRLVEQHADLKTESAVLKVKVGAIAAAASTIAVMVIEAVRSYIFVK